MSVFKGRVLFVQNYWTPYRHRLFCELSEHSDIVVDVAYLGDVGTDRQWRSETGKYTTHTLPHKKYGPFTVSDISNLDLTVYQRIVVIEHLENLPTIIRIVVKAACPVILWTGMSDNMYPDKQRYGRVVELIKSTYRPWLYKNISHVLAYSSMTVDMLLRCQIDSSMITVMPQVIDTEPFPMDTCENKWVKPYKGPLRLLSMGYLRPEKANHLLIEALNQFDPHHFQLSIAGSGPEQERLQQIASDNVQFLGYLTGEQKREALLDHDIFVLPTIRDPWALVVNEAMGAAMPVICSDRAGAKDLVKDSGWIYDGLSKQALVHTLKQILKHRHMLPNKGIKARAYAGEYTFQHAANVMKNVLSL